MANVDFILAFLPGPAWVKERWKGYEGVGSLGYRRCVKGRPATEAR